MAQALTIPDDFEVGMVVDLVVKGRPPRRVTITAVDGNTVTAAQYPEEALIRSRFARGGVIKREDIDGLTPDHVPAQPMGSGCVYRLSPDFSERDRALLAAINEGTHEPTADH